MNAITYKEVFPLIKAGKLWLGCHDPRWFYSFHTSGALYEAAHSRWFTNLEHGRRHEPLKLNTMAENLRYVRALQGRKAYARYDNYDAIEVPATVAIPSDYEGVMGVPISFLDKYCPEQFEILGASESEGKGFSNGLWASTSGVAQPLVAGERVYKRIFIKKRED